jgi:hypothetical protein
MRTTQEILFARVLLYAFWFAKIKSELILNHPHCTVFPYVRKIVIDGNLDDRYGHARTPRATWLDGFLLHAPKFTGLTSLELHSFTTLTSNTIIQTMPPVMKRGIGAWSLLISSFLPFRIVYQTWKASPPSPVGKYVEGGKMLQLAQTRHWPPFPHALPSSSCGSQGITLQQTSCSGSLASILVLLNHLLRAIYQCRIR